MYSATTRWKCRSLSTRTFEGLAKQRTEKPFTYRVHVRRAHRCPDYPDARRAGEHIEGGPELVVAIVDQEPRRSTQGGRVAKLLRHPRLRREARGRGEHDFAGGGELDEHERDDRAEEHVRHRALGAIVAWRHKPGPPSGRARVFAAWHATCVTARMWLEAILTKEDLQDVLGQFAPLEIRLGDSGKLVLATPTDVSLIEGEGMGIECDATLHWPVLGIDLPVNLRRLRVLVRPTVRPGPDGACDVLAFTLHVDRTGVAPLPDALDDRVTSLLNKELEKKHVELAWNFAGTLSHVFSLPAALASAAALSLNVKAGTVKVTGITIGFAVDFEVEVQPRLGTLERRSA
jgi:hypothetical protein